MKQHHILSLLFSIVILTMCPGFIVQADQTVTPGIYEITSALDEDLVLDVSHCTVSEKDSQALQLFSPLDVNQQKFYLESLSDGSFRIIALHSGEALTAASQRDSVSFDSLIRQENPREGDAAQSWFIRPRGQNAVSICTGDGDYLSLADSYAYTGEPLILQKRTGAGNQKWILRPAWPSSDDTADTDLINPYEEKGQFSDLRIALKFDSRYEVLDSDTLREHMTETEDHQYIPDPDFLSSYVNSLAEKYDTQGQPRRFRTSYGTEITLYKGNFGWKLDTEKTKQALADCLRFNGPKTVSPVWSHKGGAFDKGSDIGDSYVEIDLENQKVWLYKNGKKLLETDCVSGTFGTDNQTPGGVYSIFYMQSPDVLSGPGYDSPVEYWMAFNGNIGLHDASWRSEFGSDIYKSNGSHGCVNLPTDAAGLIYETVDIGYPVVCYQ